MLLLGNKKKNQLQILIKVNKKMGQCSTGNKEESTDAKNQSLTSTELSLLKNSWKPVVKQGLQQNGTNMMIR